MKQVGKGNWNFESYDFVTGQSTFLQHSSELLKCLPRAGLIKYNYHYPLAFTMTMANGPLKRWWWVEKGKVC